MSFSDANPGGTPFETDIIWFSAHLEESGGSFEANVDGSSTPVDFTEGPGAGVIWYLHSLTFNILDNGAMGHSSFGILPALSSPGLEFFLTKSGVEYRILRVRDNFEISNEFSHNSFSTDVGSGFLNEDDYFRGDFVFPALVRLSGTDSDNIIMRVNNNLAAIDRIACRIIYGVEI